MTESTNSMGTTRTALFSNLWNWLTAPSKEITDIAEQRNARLASSFLFAIAMLDLVGGLARAPRVGFVEAFVSPIGISYIVLFAAYLLSRTKWYRGAIFLFSVGFSSLAYVAMITEGSQTDFGAQVLIYVPLSLIVASSFVSTPAVFLLVGLNIGAYLSVQAFGVSLPENIGAQAGIITVIGVILMLLTSFRNNTEKIRLDELREANRELESLTTGLEQRVAERTKALSSVAEISATASTILETNKLLQMIVDLSKESFGLYHSHIYLLNEAGNTLVLAAGAGEPGQKMVAEGRSIPLDREQSLVARAAREQKGVTVNDVTQSPDFLPNPLLPNTRSELAVPIMAGEQVIGVFDVQSDIVGRFTDADIAVQTTLASQVASAIQNARSYTELHRSQALLADALKAARLGNWEFDFEKDLFTFSDEFYAIFRTTAEKVGGYRISSADYAKNFVHPEDGSLVGSEIQKVLDAKDRLFTTHLEHRIIFSDGEVGYIAVNINVERDENGKITRWYGANQDITERRRLEELNRARANQQEAINVITQRIQTATTIESALQVAARELGHALGQKSTMVTLNPSSSAGERK